MKQTLAKKLRAGHPLRFVSYARCSSDDQAFGDFTTTDVQLLHNTEHIRRRIAERGGDFVGTYSDEGKTGTNLKRRDWKRLLADAESGKFDVVVITYMSRLGRGEIFTVAEYLLKEAGVLVEMTQEKFTDDVGGYAAKRVTQLVDGMYPVQVSGWVKSKQAKMVETGYWTGGPVPFGCKTVSAPGCVDTPDKRAPRVLRPDPATQPIVLRGFEILVATRTLSPVLHHFQTAAPESRTWNYDLVKKLLRRESYKGVVVYGPNRNENAHPPIVPVELFDSAQQVLTEIEQRTTTRNAGYRISRPEPATGAIQRHDGLSYYLRGRVTCAHCDRLMTPKSASGRAGLVGYYECLTCAKHEGDCPVGRVNAGTLHRVIVGEIALAGQHPSRLDLFIRETVKTLPPPHQARQEVAALKKQERSLELSLHRLLNAVKLGGGKVAALVSEMRKLEADLAAVTAKRVTAEACAVQLEARRPDYGVIALWWKHFGAIWEWMTEEDKAMVLPALVEGVTMTARREGQMRVTLNTPALALPAALPETKNLSPAGPLADSRGKVRISSVGNSHSQINYEPVFPKFCNIPISVPQGGKRLAKIQPTTRGAVRAKTEVPAGA